MNKPKAKIERRAETITVRVKVNGSEVTGTITKRFPWTGKWLSPSFEWENVNGHETTLKAALRFNMAIAVCVEATLREFNALPVKDRRKLS